MHTTTSDLLLQTLETGLALMTHDGQIRPVNAAFSRLAPKAALSGQASEVAIDMNLGPDACQQWATFLKADMADQALTLLSGGGMAMQWRKKRWLSEEPGMCWVLMVDDVSVLHARIAQLTADCENDALTGIANRRKFDLEFSRALEYTHRTEQQGALLLFDLDSFKSINDRFGHARGDWVLGQIGPVVMPLIRRYELLARVGGDEFGILITHAGALAIERLSRQLPIALESINGAPQGKHEPLKASMGYALFPDGKASTRDIFEKADRVLYQQKNRPFAPS